MTSLFNSHRIMGIVDGTTIRPTAAGEAQTKWDQENNEALTIMLLSMTDTEVESISGCVTSHQIWTKLGSMYQSISGESKQALWQKYYSIMASPGKSPVKTMVEIQNYASQLRSMGVVIDDEMEVARVVSSLMDEKYRQFREAWRSVEITKQTSALLLSRLKTWELEDAGTNDVSKRQEEVDNQKAYTAGKSQRKPKPKRTKEEWAEIKKKTKCHLCKLTGHWRSECPSKNKQKEKKDEDSGKAYMVGLSHNFWINDSGADRHYCGRRDWFFEYAKYSTPRSVDIADNSNMFVEGVGKVKVMALINDKWCEKEIHNVEYVPGGVNLFSENVLLDRGFEVQKRRNGDIIYYRDGVADIQAEKKEGVQIMKFKPVINRAMVCVKQPTWHERLGHINTQYLMATAEKQAAYGLENIKREEDPCEICIQAKSKKMSYKTVEKTVKYQPGECLHSDLVHATEASHRGNKYFLLVKDEETSFRMIYLQKAKTETVKNVKDAVNFISNQTGNTVKMFRSDNGTEFKNAELMDFFAEKGIQVGFNPPHASQSNGLIERDVRTVQDLARAMLCQSQLSEKHWDDAVKTAAYTLNRTLNSKNREVTPYEMIFKRKPSLRHVRIFGCKAHALVMSDQRKWSSRTIQCILVGYTAASRNYILYVPHESRYIEQVKHVTFFEESLARKELSNEGDEVEKIQITIEQEVPDGNAETVKMETEALNDSEEELTLLIAPEERTLDWNEQMEEEENQRDEIPPEAPRFPQRNRKPAERYQAGFMAMSATGIKEPETFKEAANSKQSDEWKEAMDSEMRSQKENATWRLVKRPHAMRVLKSRWVYKLKTNPTGEIERFKARLVVKGYNQVEGIDYEETFAPVCRYETIRILLSIVAAKGLEILQFDIATAFLNSKLEEETYMEQPEGYEVGNNLVCKLEKGLYGLKQAPRAWHKTISEKLEAMGFKPLESDSCVYKKNKDNPIYIAMYVDDGCIIGHSKPELEKEIKALKQSFKLTMQPLTRFLGIEIRNTGDGIFIHQRKYIKDMLKRFGMSDCKSLDIPMQPGLQLEGSKPANTNYEYQELVGSLLFLTRCTRPDIAYPVHYLSRFFSKYDKPHWDAAKKVLQYLKGTMDFGILYSSKEIPENPISGFVDADYGSDKQSRKSTTGCLFTYNGAPIIWISKRQTCIALSSTESEYIALAHGGKEAVWISRMYQELGSMENDTICLKTDSQSAMKLAKNPEYHDKTKHIDIRHHYIRKLIETEQVDLAHLPDTIQPADILTKSVVKETFIRKRGFMGVQPSPSEADRKRKAMCSVISDPKRPNIFWSLLMMFLMCLTLGGGTDIHAIGSPVLWRRNHDPVVIGFQAIKMTIKLVSPCTLMPMEDVEPRIAKIMKKQCNKTYEDLFLGKLEKICPQQKSIFGKEKRFIVAAGFIVVAILASAGVGLGGFAISKTYELDTKQEELKIALDELERKMFTENKRTEVLESEVRKVTSILDQLITDFHMYKEKVVETHYLISYLTSRLMEGKKALQETGKAWNKGELTTDFLEFLNFTLPCKDDCPVEHGIFHGCLMKGDREQIILDISVPTVDRKLVKVEADPFDVMVKDGNLTCRLKYTGPTIATLSLDEDCIYETHMEVPKSKLALATSQRCSNSSFLKREETYYKAEKCKASKTGDEKEYIQVKIFNNQYHIYCPNSEYVIGKRTVECPQKVFTLPLSLTFTLNEVEYKGNVLQIVYREKEDPYLVEHVNWHLNPRIDWSNLTAEIEEDWKLSNQRIEEEAKLIPVFEFQDNGLEWSTYLLLTIAGILTVALMTLCVVVRINIKKSRQPRKKEEIPLQEASVEDHRIIIEG